LKKIFDFLRFLEKRPLKFSKFCSHRFHRHTDRRVVLKFREIDALCFTYLTKKTKFRLLSSSRYCANRVQTSARANPRNVLRVLQISSKSVHFRRSYIPTREHRGSPLESESNIRLKPSFKLNNNDANAGQTPEATLINNILF